MKPCNAKTEAAALKLQRDNYPSDPNKWGVLINFDHVSLHPPSSGDGVGRWIEIPTDQFTAIARWFLRDQKPPKRAA